MSNKLSLFKYWSSFIYPVNIDNREGNHLPKLEVNLRNGKYVLDGEKVNYSFGSLHELFRTSFNQYKINEKPLKSVLILGFGAGSVASILQKEFKMECKITGVEIDPVVIELSKKYFGASGLINTTIHCQDAFSFLKNDTSTYDLIVIDLFIEDRVPIQFAKKEFIHLLNIHLSSDGYMFYNRINNNPFVQNETTNLIETMRRELNCEINTISFQQNNASNSMLVYYDYKVKNPFVKLKRKMQRMSI